MTKGFKKLLIVERYRKVTEKAVDPPRPFKLQARKSALWPHLTSQRPANK